MLVEVSSVGIQPVVGSASDLLVSSTSPVKVTLTLGERERLDGASLVIRRTDGEGGLATPSILIDPGAHRSAEGLEQVTASWGEARLVRGLSLGIVDLPERPRVRLWVARGEGSWQPPPGSVSAVRDGARLHVTFYDTVADRVRVELLDEQGRPMPMVLADEEPLQLELSNEPHDLSLAVCGRDPVLRWSGPIPEQGLVVSDLAACLELEPGAKRGKGPLVIELSAEVAGDLELQWAFSSATTLAVAG